MRNQNPLAVLFFFSSRRRHTISLCDWSSDVCSSDLSITEVFQSATTAPAPNFWGCEVTNAAAGGSSKRSEERRVGKESKCRRQGLQPKKKTEMYFFYPSRQEATYIVNI